MTAFEFAPGLILRGVTPPLRLADFRLIAFDMDSTLINIECVDEIADAAGRKAEVAAITDAAMRGEISDYKDSLRRRVALLAGVPVAALEQVWRERVQLNPGAEILVRACQDAGLKTLLVSGGFTFFTDRICARLGLDYSRSNVLGVADGRLTGRLVDQPWGDICDGHEKRRMLLQTCERLGIAAASAIAVGDGANDLPMMGAAGLSVAYHAKPKVREQAMVSIEQGGLDRLLSVFAIPPSVRTAYDQEHVHMTVEGLSDADYAKLLDRCKALPDPSGSYAVQDFVSILMLTVLDYQLHNTVVDRAHTHFLRHHSGEIGSISSLATYLSRYPNDQQGNTAAAVALWSYKHWTRLAQLRGLVAYFQSIGVSDSATLRRWAEQAQYKNDFRGHVKGLGPAVFQWLVMRAGVETVKPDLHVISFVSSALGYAPPFDTVVRALETIARALGRRPRELDLSIWETQRGGPGRV